MSVQPDTLSADRSFPFLRKSARTGKEGCRVSRCRRWGRLVVAEVLGLGDEVAYMESTDMAVVVAQGQNEIEEMAAKGFDIKPHQERMVNEDLEIKFKDPDDPFWLVFTCAMWMTGFDVPSCSTIYLDKPMKNHTLMQTIAEPTVCGKKRPTG
jgi:hypothetical protein